MKETKNLLIGDSLFNDNSFKAEFAKILSDSLVWLLVHECVISLFSSDKDLFTNKLLESVSDVCALGCELQSVRNRFLMFPLSDLSLCLEDHFQLGNN